MSKVSEMLGGLSMGLFDKLHAKMVISKEVDDFLKSLGYVYGRTTYSGYSMKNGIGLCFLYMQSDFNTQVCIYSDEVMIYQEYTFGEHRAKKRIPIPNTVLIDKKSFTIFLNKIFDDNENLFR